MRKIALLVVCGLFSAGCKNEAVEAIAQRRAAVQAKFEQLRRLKDLAEAAAPVTREELSLGGAPLVMAFLDRTQPLTGTVVYAQDLKDLSIQQDDAPHYTQRINRAKLLNECSQLLTQGTYGSQSAANLHAPLVREYLDGCAGLEYAFVLRTRKLNGREFSGDVLLFELASGKLLGGFPLEFTSAGRTDRVTETTRTRTTDHVGSRRRTTVTTQTSTGSVNADRDQLVSDLDGAVEDAIKRLLPAVRWLN